MSVLSRQVTEHGGQCEQTNLTAQRWNGDGTET